MSRRSSDALRWCATRARLSTEVKVRPPRIGPARSASGRSRAITFSTNSAVTERELRRFDGVLIGGWELHMEEPSPAVVRQLDLMRAVFEAGVPAFGSCWGVQVEGAVAGGEARRNPKGPEFGFARRLAPTADGRGHPLLAGRPPAFDAPAIHLDAVVVPPPSCAVLASNEILPLQAAEIRHGDGVFWGVQYHPELDLGEIGLMLHVMAPDLAWRHGLDAEVLDPVRRTREIRNFIEHCVKPTRSAHGRA